MADGTLDGPLDPLGGNPAALIFDASGAKAYVTQYYDDIGDGFIYQYAVAADGKLTPLQPFAISGGLMQLGDIALHPNGQYLYAGSANRVMQYQIGADRTLSALTPASVATPGPGTIAIHPGGHYAYVVNMSSNGQSPQTVSQFAIDDAGRLASLTPPTVATGSYPVSFVIDPSGQYAFVANWHGNSVSEYAIDVTGVLVPMSGGPVSTGPYPFSIGITR
jgi:6-phosphogluconolactonase